MQIAELMQLGVMCRCVLDSERLDAKNADYVCQGRPTNAAIRDALTDKARAFEQLPANHARCRRITPDGKGNISLGYPGLDQLERHKTGGVMARLTLHQRAYLMGLRRGQARARAEREQLADRFEKLVEEIQEEMAEVRARLHKRELERAERDPNRWLH